MFLKLIFGFMNHVQLVSCRRGWLSDFTTTTLRSKVDVDLPKIECWMLSQVSWFSRLVLAPLHPSSWLSCYCTSPEERGKGWWVSFLAKVCWTTINLRFYYSVCSCHLIRYYHSYPSRIALNKFQKRKLWGRCHIFCWLNMFQNINIFIKFFLLFWPCCAGS